LDFKSLLEKDARWSESLRVAEKPGLLRTVSMVLAHSGDSWFWGLGLIILYFATSNPFWKQWAVAQFFWISILAVVVMTTKKLIRRRRPEGEWGAIYRNTDPHSFPSGHAARAFLIAVIAAGLGPAWLAVILWIWAPLVALARTAMRVHYLSDVIAGAVVGILVGLLALWLNPALMSFLQSWLNLAW
jgi:membrane-associated phospholipid phosphatase